MTETAVGPRPDANDVLMGGGDGVPAIYFKAIGDSAEGIVAAPPKAREEREFNQATQRSDGPIKKFPSGDPIYGILVDLQTSLRDPMDAEDNGLRRLYVEGRCLKDAIRSAVAAAGAKGLEVGGYLKVTHTGMKAVGTVSAKDYVAEYRSAANQAVMGGTPAAATGAAPVAQPTLPVSQPAPAPAPAAADPVALARQLIAIPGMADAAIAASTGLDVVVIGAIRAQG